MTSPMRTSRWGLFQRDFGRLRRQHRLAGNLVYFFSSYGVFQLTFELIRLAGLMDETPGLFWLLALSAIYTLTFWPARNRLGN